MDPATNTPPHVCWHADPSMINQNGLFMVSLVSAWEKELSTTAFRLFEPWNIVREKILTLNTLMGVSPDQITEILRIRSGKAEVKPPTVDALLGKLTNHQKNLLDITFSDDLVLLFIRSTINTQTLMDLISGKSLNAVLEMAKFYFESLGHFHGLFSGQFVVERFSLGRND